MNAQSTERRALALALAVSALTRGHTQDHDSHAKQPSDSSNASISVVINPEARLSVSRSGELPSNVSCGNAVLLPVKIVNQGFVTAPLEARLVDGAEEIGVEFSAQPLKGSGEELRILRVTLHKPGLWDVTIAFRARIAIPDRGGHDRIHLLLRCS